MSERHTDVLQRELKTVLTDIKAWQDRRDAELDAMKKSAADDRDRIEELEARAKHPGRIASDSREDEHARAFLKWLRRPKDQRLMAELAELETKDVTIGTDAAGGYAVPETIDREITRLEKKYSPVRDLVRVRRVNAMDYKELVTIHGTTSGWVAEGGTRSATNTSTFRQVAPTHGELYAYPQISEWALDDVMFRLDQWLAQEVAREFALQIGTAVISGNGTSKPTGMLNTTPVTTADYASPLRAAAAYQYIASDLTPGASGVVADALIDLLYSVNAAYRSNGTWVMNSATAGAVRKLKDSQNQYLWAQGLAPGQPNTLLGYPVAIWEQMPDIGANNFPVAFGDFQEGYLLTERSDIRILPDPYTNPGFVRFYVRQRVGGIPRNNDAVKFLRTL